MFNKGQFKKGHTSFWKGKKKSSLSKKTKKKISLANKGKKPNLERIFSEEWKNNISKAAKNRPPVSCATKRKFIGKNNPSWKGGITPLSAKIRNSIEYEVWRTAIFSRDGYTCQKYKTVGGKLIAHHILNFAQYPELRLAIDNGITLSDKAHKEFHKKYGKRNNTREQLEEFLNNN